MPRIESSSYGHCRVTVGSCLGEAFRVFYEKTSRALWSYLARVSGDATLAEDLVQESYYRFLRADLKSGDEGYQNNYLFRIATNLAHDRWWRMLRTEKLEHETREKSRVDERTAERVQQSSDLARALRQLKPREREILWLAYVEGCSHNEIAEVVGLRTGSIRLLLFRARRKVADLLLKRKLGAQPDRREPSL